MYSSSWDQKFPSDIQPYCQGCIAQYKIHRLGVESESVFSTTIAIPAEDIAVQIHFSLRLSPLGRWKLLFPLAISPDLRTVAVLRYLPVLDLAVCAELVQQQKVTIKLGLDHFGQLDRSWNPSRPSGCLYI